MIRLMTFNVLTFFAISLSAQQMGNHGRVTVMPNGHFLQYEDGTPFFWLGDTGWELFHRLDRDEAELYLENRRSKGFTVIQAVILAEFNGLKKPDQYGQIPLVGLDPDQPNEKYFRWVDTVITMANRKGLVMGLLPTWGDKVTLMWGEGPVIFNEQNAFRYGLWLGKRYKNFANIIWILGGDRPPMKDSTDWRPVWRAMARGILEGADQKAIFTYHISGGPNTTSTYIHNESWLSINTMQSGHGSGHDVPVWEWIARDWDLKPVKPTLDAEPNYEDHPVNPWPKWDTANGYFNDYDVRKQTYRSVFAGACGVTYGHHSVWQFWSPREEKVNHADCYWQEAINRPGAYEVGWLRQLIESRPQQNRIPDQEMTLDAREEKSRQVVGTRSSDGSFAMIYLPYGKKIDILTKFMSSEKVQAWWFNPRNAKAINIGLQIRKDRMEFTPPSLGYMNDWVLVLDDPSKGFSVPGLK
jgi:Protein of unknown function (DUF4038)/Putative collagen-binding domain of a collagenase